MLVVLAAAALVEAVALVLAVAVVLRALARMQRQHARREDLLLDRLLHATGKPWTPAPADEQARARAIDDDLQRVRFRAAPEQYPVD